MSTSISDTILSTNSHHSHLREPPPLTIAVTNPTPPRPTPSSPLSKQTPSKSPTPTFRLLYRGSLSLPDSHLLLDGLTFAARLDATTSNAGINLLQNPLALALESMRGRPTLRFMGVTKLKDVWMDESGDVAV